MECECVISIDFIGHAEDHYQRLEKYIRQYDEMIEGNAESGFFSFPLPVLGTITGVYIVSGQTLNIYIIKKPLLLSCSKIENFLRKIIEENNSRLFESEMEKLEKESIQATQNI